MKTLETAIAAVVLGDLSGLSTLRAASHPDLLGAAATLPPLIISRSALIRVLKNWRSGRFGADDVQRWASFVRRGYVSGNTSAAAYPIDIDYDAVDEELIVQIIGRFDEIGDIIDGTVDGDEQEAMLAVLEA